MLSLQLMKLLIFYIPHVKKGASENQILSATVKGL